MTLFSQFLHGNLQNKYKCLKLLESGTYASVYDAVEKSNPNNHVAIKLMKNDINEANQKDFFREIHILARKYPNCLHLIEYQFQSPAMIVTPLYKNTNLKTALDLRFANQPNSFNNTKIMCSLFGICSTLSFLHSKGVVHRDLKPQNILFDDDWYIVICDFGKSKFRVDGIWNTIGFIGSPKYAAPEANDTSLAETDEDYDDLIDVFSFGAILMDYFDPNHQILNDTNKEYTSSQNLMMRLRKGARFTKPAKMPQNYYDLYLKCCNQNSTLRPTFGSLAYEFQNNKDLLFPNVDMNEYQAYIQRCNDTLFPPQSLTSPTGILRKAHRY